MSHKDREKLVERVEFNEADLMRLKRAADELGISLEEVANKFAHDGLLELSSRQEKFRRRSQVLKFRRR